MINYLLILPRHAEVVCVPASPPTGALHGDALTNLAAHDSQCVRDALGTHWDALGRTHENTPPDGSTGTR